ncbi:hypothetical protein HJC23_010751 [Cyclotella cryptica]|uniref:Uncharacterized protein n=1 Tax=Cyclotella cryptica TaxID=29204 RepID=A0ABD3PVX6_9STRA
MASLLLDDVAQPKPDVSAGGVQREVNHEHMENAKDDENGDEGGDHEVAVPLEHKIDTGEDNDRGPFEQYFVNTNNVAEKKRLPYIMMMFRALGFNIEEIYPYSEILSDR